MRLVRRILLAVLVWAGMGGSASNQAAANPSGDEKIKVAFLYNFMMFVDWPQSAFSSGEEHLRLCIYGGESLRDALASLDGKTIKGKRIQNKECASAEEITGCHILFLGHGAQEDYVRILSTSQTSPIFTVGDNIEKFIESGGMLNFVSFQDKLKFEINEEAAQQAGFKISSKLLRLRIRIDASLP